MSNGISPEAINRMASLLKEIEVIDLKIDRAAGIWKLGFESILIRSRTALDLDLAVRDPRFVQVAMDILGMNRAALVAEVERLGGKASPAPEALARLREAAEKETYVVVVGSFLGGSRIYGPFDSRDAAGTWAEDLALGADERADVFDIYKPSER